MQAYRSSSRPYFPDHTLRAVASIFQREGLRAVAQKYCRGSMKRATILVNAAGRFGFLPASSRQTTFYEQEQLHV